jgi:hypothetical protein
MGNSKAVLGFGLLHHSKAKDGDVVQSVQVMRWR